MFLLIRAVPSLKTTSHQNVRLCMYIDIYILEICRDNIAVRLFSGKERTSLPECCSTKSTKVDDLPPPPIPLCFSFRIIERLLLGIGELEIIHHVQYWHTLTYKRQSNLYNIQNGERKGFNKDWGFLLFL